MLMDEPTRDRMLEYLREMAHRTLDLAVGEGGEESIKEVCYRLRAISVAIDAIEDEPTS